MIADHVVGKRVGQLERSPAEIGVNKGVARIDRLAPDRKRHLDAVGLIVAVASLGRWREQSAAAAGKPPLTIRSPRADCSCGPP